MRDDLPHAMRETARRLEPDVARLTEGGVSRGTRMRRIERAVQVLGSAVAVAVVFAGVVLFGAHKGIGTGAETETGTGTGTRTGDGREANKPAASSGESAPASGPPSMAGTPTATTPAPATTPGSSSSPSPSGTAQITQLQLIASLKKSLGRTDVTGRSFVADGTDSPPTATMIGEGTILVDAQLATAKSVGFLSIVFSGHRSPVPRSGAPRLLLDGSVVYVLQQAGSSDGHNLDRTDLEVTLVRPDGSSLSALETNAPTSKSAAAFAGAPLLLTSDQVVTMLDSSIWDSAVAAADALPSADGAGFVPTSTSPASSPS